MLSTGTLSIYISWVNIQLYIFCLSNSRLADAEDEIRALRKQLKENQRGNYQEIDEMGKELVMTSVW